MRHYRQWKPFAMFFFSVIIAAGVLGFSHSQQASALDNGLTETPPMGFNDWNAFGCNVDAELIKETADNMVESGMKEAGYEYVNIDDCWMTHQRDEDGNLVVDPEKFPNGMKAVADYVHSLGLKIGIYESAGTTTCAGFPGSIEHEKQDAESYASWGIDYLKYDNCGDHLGQSAQERYAKMRDALAATGRDIVFSMCEWGSNDPWEWAKPYANLWRTTGDISDNWSSVMSILDQQVGLYKYAGPGHWNDPDMLEVGNGGMTPTEYRAHFSLWSILAAPLIAGNDIRNMSETTEDILTNKEVIAVDQDAAGIQGHKIQDDGDHEVWMKPLANGDRAVVLLNRGMNNATMSVDAKDLGLKHASAYIVRDLWAHKETASAHKVSASVPSHGVAMFRVSSGTPAQAPPTATLSTDAPDFVASGETGKMTMTLTNNGRIAMNDVHVSLDAPEGWNIEPTSKTTFANIPPEGDRSSVQLTWEVTAPENAEAGTANLMTDVAYQYHGETVHVQSPLSVQVPPEAPTQDAYLSDLPWLNASAGWREVQRDESVENNPITLNGQTYSKGIGTHAHSEITYYLGGNLSSFKSDIGLDDEKNNSPGSITFQVWGDGKKLYDSGVMTGENPTQHLEVDITGVNILSLIVNDGGDGIDSDHADWANARVLK